MILVDIYFPAVDMVYDFRLDENVKIIHLLQEIQEMMCKKYRSVLNDQPEKFMLCTMESKKILTNDSTLAANGIKNGARLMIV